MHIANSIVLEQSVGWNKMHWLFVQLPSMKQKLFSSFQAAFDTFFLTLVKVIVMTVGELDYTTLLVDSLENKNPATKAPLVPYRESSFIFLCLFVFAMPIILMNLLVSKKRQHVK